MLAVLAVLTGLFMVGCDPAMFAPRPAYHPAPCSAVVPPIRNSALAISVSVNATYNAKDLAAGRSYTQNDAIAYLNELGTGDNNTFAAQNGNQLNFTFAYTINNDGQDHFTGSLVLSGWGEGWIHTFSSSGSYSDASQMFRELTSEAYGFIHGGWHDSRPSCPQS
jgi:hypothetical protein